MRKFFEKMVKKIQLFSKNKKKRWKKSLKMGDSTEISKIVKKGIQKGWIVLFFIRCVLFRGKFGKNGGALLNYFGYMWFGKLSSQNLKNVKKLETGSQGIVNNNNNEHKQQTKEANCTQTFDVVVFVFRHSYNALGSSSSGWLNIFIL